MVKKYNNHTDVLTCSARSSNAVNTLMRYMGSFVMAFSLKSILSRQGSSPNVSTEPIFVKLLSLRLRSVSEYILSRPKGKNNPRLTAIDLHDRIYMSNKLTS